MTYILIIMTVMPYCWNSYFTLKTLFWFIFIYICGGMFSCKGYILLQIHINTLYITVWYILMISTAGYMCNIWNPLRLSFNFWLNLQHWDWQAQFTTWICLASWADCYTQCISAWTLLILFIISESGNRFELQTVIWYICMNKFSMIDTDIWLTDIPARLH